MKRKRGTTRDMMAYDSRIGVGAALNEHLVTWNKLPWETGTQPSLVDYPPCANPQKNGHCGACWYCLRRSP